MRDARRVARLTILLPFLIACGTGTKVEPGDASSPPDVMDAGIDSGCPRDLPPSCPADVPSYKDTVSSIIQGRCFPCHAAGGQGTGGGHLYTSYAAIHADRGSILTQVYACNMPLPDASAPLPEERAALLTWLVCGAPNN